MNSHYFQHLTGVTHWVSFQDIQKNYHRNLPETFDVCSPTPSKRQSVLKQVWSVVDEIPELEHIRISNRGDGRFSEYCSPERPSSLKCKLRRSLFFTKIEAYRISGTTTTLLTSAQKPKFLNNYQIFFKKFDENSLKTFTGLAANIRYRDTTFKSSLIFCSASILCTWAMFWFVLHYIFLDVPRISKLERS